MRIHFPTLGIAGAGVEPTSNGAGSPHACVGWATEAPVRMEAVRGHSPGGGPVVGRWCIEGCGHKGGVDAHLPNRCTLLTTGNVPAELKHIWIHLKAEEWEKVLMDHPDDGSVAYLLS